MTCQRSHIALPTGPVPAALPCVLAVVAWDVIGTCRSAMAFGIAHSHGRQPPD